MGSGQQQVRVDNNTFTRVHAIKRATGRTMTHIIMTAVQREWRAFKASQVSAARYTETRPAPLATEDIPSGAPQRAGVVVNRGSLREDRP